MLWEFTSRWYARAETLSKVGASCSSSSRARWQASTKRCWSCSVLEDSEDGLLLCRSSRKLSRGTPGTRVMASRTRQVSFPTQSASMPTRSGIRSNGLPSLVQPRSLPPGDCPGLWRVQRSLPSKAALARSCGVRHRISLMATSPIVPSTRSAAQTVPKLPVPRAEVTWHLQPPIVSMRPTERRISGTLSFASAASFFPRLYKRYQP
mmetsp:Transcript_12480/g.29288  ORF Transcript_12480/g.29288 Transcript_12480/m.29288 type:complete len:207 (-) Transcript_12480:21-641(-)